MTDEAMKMALAKQLTITMQNLGAPVELLCIVGSYGDTQTDSDILEMLEQHNERGTCMDVIIAPEFMETKARRCIMTDYTGSNTPADQRDLWRTPSALFASLDAEFCFQLDAAAAPHNALCRKFITAEQNTLETPWADYLSIPGYVWLNPPYSDITPFRRPLPRAPIRSARSCWYRLTLRLAGSRRLSRPPARFALSPPGGWHLSTRSPVSQYRK
jgi:hypothetical protein